MRSFGWPSPAKLNLFLHIIGRRTDGYHLLQTVFQFIELTDKINFTILESGTIKRSSYAPFIDENFSIDNCTHSFFGVSKIYSDFIAQEYGKNNKLNTGICRAGCITGPNHSGAKLHGFLSFLIKSCLKKKSYNIIGYKGKQVRDNIHSLDLVNCFWEFYKNPKKGEIYNIGGGTYSNCSILEAINIIEKITKLKIKIKYDNKNRIGDHIWYVSDLKKFKKDFPNWKQKYNSFKIIKELIETNKNYFDKS